MTDDRLVEQARELVGDLGAGVEEVDSHDDVMALLAGLADEVEQLQAQRDEAVAALSESCNENRINAIAESVFLTCPADVRVATLEAENEELRVQLEAAQLRSIEARNPGIDMERVARERRAHLDAGQTDQGDNT